MKIIIEKEKLNKQLIINIKDEISYDGYLQMNLIHLTLKEFIPLRYGLMRIVYSNKEKEIVRLEDIRTITKGDYCDLYLEYYEHKYNKNKKEIEQIKKIYEIENQHFAEKENKIKEIRIFLDDLSNWD